MGFTIFFLIKYAISKHTTIARIMAARVLLMIKLMNLSLILLVGISAVRYAYTPADLSAYISTPSVRSIPKYFERE